MSSQSAYFRFLRRIQAPRRTLQQSLLLASILAFEALLAGILLYFGYRYFDAPGYGWALVSAILVLQPGLDQSLNTACVRIAANLIGAFFGLLIGYYFGVQVTAILAAILIVIFLCELLRLDLGVRSACVSVIIVMTANDGKVITSSIERGLAVLVGCILALILQLLLERVLVFIKILPKLAYQATHPSLNSQGSSAVETE